MSKEIPSNLPIIIKLESKDYASEDSEWQEECRRLYVQIKKDLDEGTVEPLRVEKQEKGNRSPEFLDIYNMIILGISSLSGFRAFIDIATPWLEHRKRAEITLKFPDGSEMKVSGASKEDILNLYEKHLAKQGK